MRKLIGKSEITESAADLLTDESGLSGGWCIEAVWPESTEKAVDCIREYHDRNITITLSGALTGIAGGAVPDGGVVISSAALKGIEPCGNDTLKVMAGTTLEELQSWIEKNMPGRFYPPDPTELTASMGGTVATDASGSDSYLYGSTRKWIRGMEIVLPDGKLLRLARNEYCFDDSGTCVHPVLGRLSIPGLHSDPPLKNAAGYWIRPGMDLIDLFIGSEGTLGFVTSAEIILSRQPVHVVDIGIFAGMETRFWDLLHFFRECSLRVRALEMMDSRCLGFLLKHQQDKDLGLPENKGWVLLARLEANSENELDEILVEVEEAVEKTGLSPDMVWGGFEPHERKRLRDFRHTLPEMINTVIAERQQRYPSIHKLGTDSAVPLGNLRNFYNLICGILTERNLDFVVFGHAGQGHLHANILPNDPSDEQSGEDALREIAKWAVSKGGTVSAEHGLGRLKADLIELMYTPGELDRMRELRRIIDPGGKLAEAICWP